MIANQIADKEPIGKNQICGPDFGGDSVIYVFVLWILILWE